MLEIIDSDKEWTTLNIFVYGMNDEIISQFAHKFSEIFHDPNNLFFKTNTNQNNSVISFHFKRYSDITKINLHYISEISFYDLQPQTKALILENNLPGVKRLNLFVYDRIVEGSLNSIFDISTQIKTRHPIFVDLSDCPFEDEQALKYCAKHKIKYITIIDFNEHFIELISEPRQTRYMYT